MLSSIVTNDDERINSDLKISLIGELVPNKIKNERRESRKGGRGFGDVTSSESETDSTRYRAAPYLMCLTIPKIRQRSFERCALGATMNRHF